MEKNLRNWPKKNISDIEIPALVQEHNKWTTKQNFSVPVSIESNWTISKTESNRTIYLHASQLLISDEPWSSSAVNKQKAMERNTFPRTQLF